MIRVHRRHPLVRVGEYRRSFLGPCRSTTNIVACVEIRHAVICKNFRDDRSAKGWASALLRSRYCGAMVLAQARRRTSPQAASTRQINLPFCEPFCCEPFGGHAGSRLRLAVSMSQYFPPPFHEPDDHQDSMQPPSPHQHIFSVYISWQVSLHSGQKSTFGTCCWSTSTSTTTATIVEESNVDIKLMRDNPHLTL